MQSNTIDTAQKKTGAASRQDSLIYLKREQDWRNGALVYQVLVDRFVPAADLTSKQHLYPAPKKLMAWQQTPQHGEYLADEALWSHEIEFWGGDLASLASQLDYIQSLGMDVLYLNPIHLAYTNHKYDSLDFKQISPEFGSRADVIKLTEQVHQRGMKIVLDGVFNHMGRNADIYQDALNNPKSDFIDWFDFNPDYPSGHRAWANAVNLPELNLENQTVREHIWLNPDSVVQSYLKQGIDGWRLDVAHDIGFTFLTELTEVAHQVKTDALVVGEIWCYPKEWFPAVDGVMNFTLREIIWRLCNREIKAPVAMRMLQQMLDDCDIEHLLKSWLVLDNHDTPRLPNMLPAKWQQQMAQLMLFTLPGSPNLYYGSELGMTGGDDPEMRAPMRWDWVNDENATLSWVKQLIELRKNHRALKIGDCRTLATEHFIAYERFTDKVADSVIVVANPTAEKVTEYLMIANSKLMNLGGMINLLDNDSAHTSAEQLAKAEPVYIKASVIKVTLAAGEFAVFSPDVTPVNGYTTYKRVP